MAREGLHDHDKKRNREERGCYKMRWEKIRFKKQRESRHMWRKKIIKEKYGAKQSQNK